MRMTAKPLHVVDGFARGPNGARLSPFAAFADLVRGAGGSVADPSGEVGGGWVASWDDGSVVVVICDD